MKTRQQGNKATRQEITREQNNKGIREQGNKESRKPRDFINLFPCQLISLSTYLLVKLLTCSLVLLSTCSPLWAHFEDTGIGARADGLANAYVGLVDDTYSLYYNPAGLGRIRWKEAGLDYNKLWWGLDDKSKLGQGFAGYAQPIKTGARSEKREARNRDWGTVGIGWLNFGLSEYYSENSFIFGFGRRIAYPEVKSEKLPKFLKIFLNKAGGGKLTGGLNLKILSRKYWATDYTENAINLDTAQRLGGRDPVFADGYSRTNLAIDLGLLYDFTRHHCVGFSLKDFNHPDMGLNGKDKVGVAAKLGYAYRGRDFNMVSDLAIGKGSLSLQSGAEKWFFAKQFAVRGGLGIGSREYTNLSLGAGWRYNSLFQLDYSFKYPLRGISSIYGSHQISLTLRLGMPAPEEVEITQEIKKLQAELESANEKAEEEKLRAEEAVRAKAEFETMAREASKRQTELEESLQQAEERLRYVSEISTQPVMEIEIKAEIEKLRAELAEAKKIAEEEKLRAEEAMKAKAEFEKAASAAKEEQRLAEEALRETKEKLRQAEEKAEVAAAPPIKPPPEAVPEEVKEEVTLKNVILFEVDSSTLTPSGRRTIDRVVETLVIFPLQKASIEGHADINETGPSGIAEKRAVIVRDVLTEEYDISPERITIKAFGADKLAADPSTADGQAQNRRVEITIIK